MQFERRPHRALIRLRVPHDFVETFDPAVERVRAIVCHERVLLAVQSKFAFGNAVAIAANQAAEVGCLFDVFRQGIVA